MTLLNMAKREICTSFWFYSVLFLYLLIHLKILFMTCHFISGIGDHARMCQ